jgi:hypothetical protein
MRPLAPQASPTGQGRAVAPRPSTPSELHAERRCAPLLAVPQASAVRRKEQTP